MKKTTIPAFALLSLASLPAFSRGVSPYLPLNLDPAIERQIERVLILADKPALTRPFAAATILDALPTACRIEPILCQEVRSYLARYMRNWSVTDASLEAAHSPDTTIKTLPTGTASPRSPTGSPRHEDSGSPTITR
jgi:hypothetical protein